MMKKLCVVVLMGGRSAEHEVSLLSGKKVMESLNPQKYEAIPLIISQKGKGFEKLFRLAENRTGDCLVFIAMHGPFGEDGTVQGMLETMGISYTGAGILASALGLDKPMFRKVMLSEKITSPEYLVLRKGRETEEITRKFLFPVVVKPSSQGSSVGVSLVRKKEELKVATEKAFSYGPRIMVEEYLLGTEVSCGVLGNRKPFALPVVEIVPKKEFFDYEAKYSEGFCEEIVPARISQKLTQEVQKIAVRVYKAVGCQGFGRVDMIIKSSLPYVLEINTIPGLTPLSLLPKEAAAAGISYQELIERLINFALDREI